jgi:hypothetical protein
MSTIKVNDITNVAGGIPTVNSQRLIPTAWVNFNGTGVVAIRDSENVSSITDVGTGSYDVNFTTAMASINFIGVVSGTLNNFDTHCAITQPTATAFIRVYASRASALEDNTSMHVAILGGQA